MKKLFFTVALVATFAFAKAESKSSNQEVDVVNYSMTEESKNLESFKFLRLTPEEASRVLENSQFNGKSVDVKHVAQDIIIIIFDDGEIWIIFY